jgi:hypothetical protein
MDSLAGFSADGRFGAGSDIMICHAEGCILYCNTGRSMREL